MDEHETHWIDGDYFDHLLGELEPGAIAPERDATPVRNRRRHYGLSTASDANSQCGEQETVCANVSSRMDTPKPISITSQQFGRVSYLSLPVCALCGDKHCDLHKLWSGNHQNVHWKFPSVHELRPLGTVRPQTPPPVRPISAFPELHSTPNLRTDSQGSPFSRQKFASYLKWVSLHRSPNGGARR